MVLNTFFLKSILNAFRTDVLCTYFDKNMLNVFFIAIPCGRAVGIHFRFMVFNDNIFIAPRTFDSPGCRNCPRFPCRRWPWSWWPRTNRCWCWPWPTSRWTPSWTRVPCAWAIPATRRTPNWARAPSTWAAPATIAATAAGAGAVAAWTGWACVGRRRTWSGAGAVRWTRWRSDRYRVTRYRNWKPTTALVIPAPTSSREPPFCVCLCRWPRQRRLESIRHLPVETEKIIKFAKIMYFTSCRSWGSHAYIHVTARESSRGWVDRRYFHGGFFFCFVVIGYIFVNFHA